MPRPTNKAQLLTAMQHEHDVIETLCHSLSLEQMTRTSQVTQCAVKDVLAHLAEWEQMCLGWYAAGVRGETPHLPAPGFNWAQIPALNQQIYEKYRDWPLAEVLKRFRASYQQILQILQGLSDADLFTPARYGWTNKNAMATYFISATSSHYVWGQKEVRKCLKDEGIEA